MIHAAITVCLLISFAGIAHADEIEPIPSQAGTVTVHPVPESLNRPGVGVDVDNAVTPYGDFCPRCRVYGFNGKKMVMMHEAVEAVESYFNHRGLFVKNINGIGRFVIMDIRGTDNLLVDKIVFDRMTGRIRSVR